MWSVWNIILRALRFAVSIRESWRSKNLLVQFLAHQYRINGFYIERNLQWLYKLHIKQIPYISLYICIHILHENIDEFLYILSGSKQKSVSELESEGYWYFIVEICLRYCHSSAVTVSMTFIYWRRYIIQKCQSMIMCVIVAILCALQVVR